MFLEGVEYLFLGVKLIEDVLYCVGGWCLWVCGCVGKVWWGE